MHLKKYKKRQLILQYLYRKRYFKFSFFILLLNLIIKNKYIEKQFKVLAVFFLIKLNRFNFASFHQNICLYSGHKRSVLNFFKLNRLIIFNKLNNLTLPGINRTLW